MKQQLKGIGKAFLMVLVIFLVLGYAYPMVSALISEHVLPGQSDGSQASLNGTVYGSYLLAEAFNSSVFFHPRPSAVNYNSTQSGSYSYSPDNPDMMNITRNDLKQFMMENPGLNRSQIPYAMVAVSGSGLDPNIPSSGAYLQIPRIADAIHNLSLENQADNGTGNVLSINSTLAFLGKLVDGSQKQDFPLFGSYYVNTVSLNFDIISLLMDNGVIKQSFLD